MIFLEKDDARCSHQRCEDSSSSFSHCSSSKTTAGSKTKFLSSCNNESKQEDPKKRNTHDKVFATELKKIKKV